MGDAEITIPVLNEEERLASGIDATLRFLDDESLHGWRVLIADNGSTDATPTIARRLERQHPARVAYLRVEQRGVGAAVRSSWSRSSANVVGYMDVDLATDLRHLLEVEALFRDPQVEIVNGSRLLPTSNVIGRSLKREITSRGLNLMLRTVLDASFTDAMCGFKFFRRSTAVNLLTEVPHMPDWFLTAEMLVKAEWHGLHVHEIAVTWQDDPRSKAKIASLARQYLGHIVRLRRERTLWAE